MQSIPYSRHGESPVLTTELQPDVLLFGLGPLIGSGRPGFDGHYRVVRIGPRKAIEFFDGPPMGAGKLPIKILPYRQGEIATVTVGTKDEAISGEFTGCVMTLYRDGSTLKAGRQLVRLSILLRSIRGTWEPWKNRTDGRRTVFPS